MNKFTSKSRSSFLSRFISLKSSRFTTYLSEAILLFILSRILVPALWVLLNLLLQNSNLTRIYQKVYSLVTPIHKLLSFKWYIPSGNLSVAPSIFLWGSCILERFKTPKKWRNTRKKEVNKYILPSKHFIKEETIHAFWIIKTERL